MISSKSFNLKITACASTFIEFLAVQVHLRFHQAIFREIETRFYVDYLKTYFSMKPTKKPLVSLAGKLNLNFAR